MQHKEEAESLPGVHCIKAGRGLLFFMGLSSSRQQGGGGTPPMRGGAVCVESAAGYEYVHSPTEYKNKIYPSTPHAGTCRKN